jgi:ABC-type lipoprotein export system ATPase subunit/ABC-type antimicrobial peptide transport system permease subunit
MEAIKLLRVSKYYHQGDQVSVGMKQISLTFNMGEFVAVTGESGSGKSTLLNVLSGLDKYEEGEMFIFGEETSHYEIKDFEKYRREYVGFVFQNYNIIDSYTVLQNVLLALELQDYPKETRKQRALELIELVGLTRQKNQKSSKLSGGQKQRAVIARALAKDTPILVADEPTGNLDQASAAQIIQLLKMISKEKLVILVTHEFDQVKDVATRRIKMSDGEVVEDKHLQNYQSIDEKPLVKDTKTTFMKVFNFAIRNLLSQPKRFLFMLLLLTIAISVFTIVYSNQMYNLRTQGLEQSFTYPSVPSSRVLVERRDGSLLLDEDVSLLLSKTGVEAVHPYGALLFNDINLILSTSNENMYSGNTYYVRYTDVASQLSPSNLESGRLPENEKEVVFSPNFFDDITLNQTLYVYLQDGGYYDSFESNEKPKSILEVTVVGITSDDASTLYFSDSYLDTAFPSQPTEIAILKTQLLRQVQDSMVVNMNGQSIYVEPQFLWNETFDMDFGAYMNDDAFTTETGTLTFQARSLNGIQIMVQRNLTYQIPNADEFYWATMDQSLYEDIIDEMILQVQDEYVSFPSRIASVSVSNQLSGTQLIENLDSSIYKVYYPSNLSSPLQEFLVFMLTIVAVIVLVILGLFLYAVIHAVTRNMMSSRKKDFSIFRSVGAHQQTLSLLVILEQIILSIIGLVLAITILQIIVTTTTDHGLNIEYMLFRDYVILTLAIMILGMWLGLRFNKKVFNQTVIQALSQGGEE